MRIETTPYITSWSGSHDPHPYRSDTLLAALKRIPEIAEALSKLTPLSSETQWKFLEKIWFPSPECKQIIDRYLDIQGWDEITDLMKGGMPIWDVADKIVQGPLGLFDVFVQVQAFETPVWFHQELAQELLWQVLDLSPYWGGSLMREGVRFPAKNHLEEWPEKGRSLMAMADYHERIQGYLQTHTDDQDIAFILSSAILNDRYQLLFDLLRGGANPNHTIPYLSLPESIRNQRAEGLLFDDGMPLIEVACAKGSAELVRALLDKTDKIPFFALHTASSSPACTALIVEAGADLDVQIPLNLIDTYNVSNDAKTYEEHLGLTPLLQAAKNGNHEIVDFLLQCGADPYIKGVDHTQCSTNRWGRWKVRYSYAEVGIWTFAQTPQMQHVLEKHDVQKPKACTSCCNIL